MESEHEGKCQGLYKEKHVFLKSKDNKMSDLNCRKLEVIVPGCQVQKWPNLNLPLFIWLLGKPLFLHQTTFDILVPLVVLHDFHRSVIQYDPSATDLVEGCNTNSVWLLCCCDLPYVFRKKLPTAKRWPARINNHWNIKYINRKE